MVGGHRGTDMPWSLNAPGSGAKTGAATHSFEQSEESRPGLGLRRSARPQPARYDRTGRNMSARPTVALSSASQVDCYKARTRVKSLVIETTDAMDASRFYFSRFCTMTSISATAELLSRRTNSARRLQPCPQPAGMIDQI